MYVYMQSKEEIWTSIRVRTYEMKEMQSKRN